MADIFDDGTFLEVDGQHIDEVDATQIIREHEDVTGNEVLSESGLTISDETCFLYGDVDFAFAICWAFPIEEGVYLIGYQLLTDGAVDDGACHGENHSGICLRGPRTFQPSLELGDGGGGYLREEDVTIEECGEFSQGTIEHGGV